MGRLSRFFDRWIRFFRLESWLRLLMLCILVGAVAGLAAVLFETGLQYAGAWVFERHIEEMEFDRLVDLAVLLALPAAGFFLAGWLGTKWAPEVCGSGVDAVIRAFHKGKGQIRARATFLKGLCTIFTIGAGGSAGREGPTAQIGAGVGSVLGNALKLSVRDRRLLMLAGCAAGLGAVLRAPLGAALFSAEMLYREPDFEHGAVIPGVISSVTAYSVLTAFLGYEPALSFAIMGEAVAPHFPSQGGSLLGELFHYALLSLICAFVAYLFVQGLRLMKRHVFARLPVATPWKALSGGLLLGALVAVFCFSLAVKPGAVMGEGKTYVQDVIGHILEPGAAGEAGLGFTARMLLLVIFLKIVATGLTVGSGASGGLLFPTLFIGAITGALYAKLWLLAPSAYMPGALLPTPEARAGMIMVAMGGLFCGCTKTPIASLVLVSEMTGSYAMAVPLMICCSSTYLLTTSFTMDEEQVAAMSDSPAHRGDFLVDVLEEIRVKEAIRNAPVPEVIPSDLPFEGVLERVRHSSATTFPIVDENGCLIGIFSLSDIRQIMFDRTVGSLVVAGDLGTANVVTITPQTTLNRALKLFTRKNVNVLPVVEESPEREAKRGFTRRIIAPRGPVGSKRVIGMLSRQDLIAAYRNRLMAIKQSEAKDAEGGTVVESAQESIAVPVPAPVATRVAALPSLDEDEHIQVAGELDNLDVKELLGEPGETGRIPEVEDFPEDPYGPKPEYDDDDESGRVDS